MLKKTKKSKNHYKIENKNRINYEPMEAILDKYCLYSIDIGLNNFPEIIRKIKIMLTSISGKSKLRFKKIFKPEILKAKINLNIIIYKIDWKKNMVRYGVRRKFNDFTNVVNNINIDNGKS